MNFINMVCPPLPYFIVGGEHIYRPGDIHERRIIRNIFDLIYVYKGELHMEQEPFHVTLQPGQFFIVIPDQPHRGSRICTEQTTIFWLHFYTSGKYYLSEDFVPDCVTRRALLNFITQRRILLCPFPAAAQSRNRIGQSWNGISSI